MRAGHGQNSRDRRYASAADTGDQYIPALRSKCRDQRSGRYHRRAATRRMPLRRGAFEHHKGGAEARKTRQIFIAGGLVDASLAAVFGVEWLDGDAARLHAAVARTLRKPSGLMKTLLRSRVGGCAFARRRFSAAQILIVDENADAFDLAQALLHLVQLISVTQLDLTGQRVRASEARGIFRHHDDCAHAFGQHLSRDIGDR